MCLYDAQGTGRALAVDLDVSRGGRGQVVADSDRLTTLLHDAGARFLVDESPSGGRHVWVPLSTRRSAVDLQRVIRALAVLLPSLDPAPALNVATGCLRPPGAAHPAGGHQQLLTPWARAVDAVRTGTDSAAWTRLLGALAPELTAADVHDADPAATVGPQATVHGGGARPLPDRYDAIARTGRHDEGRYRSPSEARMAVLASAAARGWSRADVQAMISDGRWPGLAGYYSRYRPHQRPGALGRDWNKAFHYAAIIPSPPVANSHTGELPTQPRAGRQTKAAMKNQRSIADGELRNRNQVSHQHLSDYVHVRIWRTAVDLAISQRWSDRAGQSKRAVLAALAEAAHRRGSRYLDVGCRSLGLGSALEHSTVADVLRSLREEDDPFLVLLEDHRGERGDLYELRVPDALSDQAETIPWRSGRLSGLHPVYRELGVPAAHLYDAIGEVGSTDVDTLIDRSHLSRATVYRTAAVLASHGLLVRRGRGWSRTRLRLDVLARRLGIPSRIQALLTRYRAERLQWRALLGLSRGLAVPHPLAVLAEIEAIPPPSEPPPDIGLSPLELLNLLLGAVPIDR